MASMESVPEAALEELRNICQTAKTPGEFGQRAQEVIDRYGLEFVETAFHPERPSFIGIRCGNRTVYAATRKL